MDSIDVAISFDTTGSMYPCLAEVRRRITTMIGPLFRNIPNLRIAIIAHGDYCDARSSYVTKVLDFCESQDAIEQFVRMVGATHGGDFPECYELVLREARTLLNWQSGKSKALIVIGDATPHEASYSMNTMNLDWRNEARLLGEAGVTVYGCHAMPGVRQMSKYFYEAIAEYTDGFYLTLDQFSAVRDMLMGVCYKQNDIEQFVSYVSILNSEGRMTRGLRNSFSNMGATVSSMGAEASPKSSVASGRFQVFDVDSKQDIRSFVEERGISFAPGRGFYQLTKSVKVQQYKEIFLVHKRTREVYNGATVREQLGLLPQTSPGVAGTIQRLSTKSFLADYDIFIQSTSYNRVLLPETKFMYEVEDWDVGSMSDAVPGGEALKYKASTTVKVAAPKKASKKKKKAPTKKAKAVAVTSSETASMVMEKEPDMEVTKTITIIIPPALKNAKRAYDLKKRYPKTKWDIIAKASGYGSASGARKGAKKIASLIE